MLSHLRALFGCGEADVYLCLGGRLSVSRKVIYAAGLLHDIGKDLQYTDGIPHEESSAQIAARILPDCEVSREEQEIIVD